MESFLKLMPCNLSNRLGQRSEFMVIIFLLSPSNFLITFVHPEEIESGPDWEKLVDAASAADDWMIFSDPVAALSSPIVATYISSSTA